MRNAEIFNNIDAGLLARFKAYHNDNPHVWREFKAKSFELKAARDRGSHWLILNAVRWANDVKATNEPFKINNDFASIYARLMIYNFPEFEGFFELRAMKASDRKLSNEEINRKEGSK